MSRPAEHYDLTGDLAVKIRAAQKQSKVPTYIAVEGPIGVGKTTLSKRLASVFGYQTLLEPAAENPFLGDFYRRSGQALATQLFFLLHRARQINELQTDDLLGNQIVADFLMAKDALFAKLTLDDHEFQLYEQINTSLQLRPPKPDLVIYLQAPTAVLMQRIRNRGIDFEQHIEGGYLDNLIAAYTEFFHFYDSSPLLVVNAAEIDFAHNDQHFVALVERVLSMDGMRQYFNPHPTLI